MIHIIPNTLRMFLSVLICVVFITTAVGKVLEMEARDFIKRSKQEQADFVEYLDRNVKLFTRRGQAMSKGRIDRRIEPGKHKWQVDPKSRNERFAFGDKETKKKIIKENVDTLKRFKELHNAYSKNNLYRIARMKKEELRIAKLGILVNGRHSDDSKFHNNETSSFNVFQIIDGDSLLIKHGDIIKVSGIDTSNLTDKSRIDLEREIVEVRTFQYTTVLGGTKTIYELKILTDEERLPLLNELITKKDKDKAKETKKK